jgi:transmembrane sensor
VTMTDPTDKLRAVIDQANAPFVEDEVAVRRARAALIARARAARPGPRRWRAAAVLAALALAATGGALLTRHRLAARAVLTFTIAGIGTPPRTAAGPRVHHGPALQTTEVRFSDGSVMSMAPRSQFDVDVAPATVNVHLHAGSLRAHVVHRERATWLFHAGPFEVRVTGTRFETGWDQTKRIFTLSLVEGGVVVKGPHLRPDGQVVRAGDALRVAVADGVVAWEPPVPGPDLTPNLASDLAPDLAPGAAATTPAAAEPGARATTPRPAPPARPARPPTPPPPDAPVAADDETGLARASATELLLLADAARMAGAPERARAALRALRARFPGTTQAATARFALGRLAFDVDRDVGQAASHFQAYLDEAPDGPLVREAAGRLLEARAQLGDRGAAAEAARAYLRRFPDGPRADLARHLLP